MKKIFTFFTAALLAMSLSAQVNSTRVELSPLHADADNSTNTTWKFVNTDITITNNSSKSYASVDRFGDPTGTGDTCEISFLKMSKDVLFKINIPDGQVAVRIEFWGLSNSSAANWAYLCYLANPALPTPIVSVEGGQTVDGITGRDIMDNEAIKALAYPFSPSPVQAETKPVAVIEDPLGWYSELSFLYDGNNQVGANIVVYTVAEADLESYDPAKDQSIKNSLDQAEASDGINSTRVELSPLHADADNSDNTTWKFVDTDITITNNSSKSYASVDRFGDPTGTGDTCEISFLKMSKDVLFKINIPDGQVAVRIEFWGLSNSSAANWAYLCYLANPALPTPIVSVEGGQTVDGITGRDIMDNEAIKALAYPFSPSPVQAETKPVAVIEDPLGWYSELSFLYDGNNQVGANIVVYTVAEADLESYDPAKDQSIKNSLDQPESSSVIEVESDPTVPTIDYNAPMYNILGQPVTKDYKGVIIQKGHKFILK